MSNLARAAEPPRAEEGPVLFVAKALIATFGVCLFLLPLATPAGLVAGLGGTFAGYVLARLVHRFVRLPLAVGVGLVAIAAAHFSSQWVLGGIAGRDPLGAVAADVIY